ncbi:MAG: hypothetical protein ACI395_10280, partial [Candidatus Cryptobacteroides sp.]
NKKGIDIPVVTVRYSIWNFGNRNQTNLGTPAYIAKCINDNSKGNPFSIVMVHAWSKFSDIGNSPDLLDENAGDGKIYGPGAAEMCMRRLDNDVNVISLHELIWRIRMYYRPEQTKTILKSYK